MADGHPAIANDGTEGGAMIDPPDPAPPEPGHQAGCDFASKPRCRDCADYDGTCPHDGTPCDPREWKCTCPKVKP